MKNRIIQLRATLGLKQYQFAERLGVTNTAVCAWEAGRRNLTEQTILSICREFKVNYYWLTKGELPMFTDTPESVVDEIAEDYNLDSLDKKIIEKYLDLSQEHRKVIKEYLKSIFT